MFDALWQNLRYAIRAVRTRPGFAAVVVVSLTLGIGANTAIFSLINALILRPLPVRHPEELIQVTMGSSGFFSNPIWEQIRDRQDAFAGMLAYGSWSFNVAAGGEARNVNGHFVAGSYFETLGVRPILGRILTRSDDQRGCSGAAVLSHNFWQREYEGRSDILGKTISLDHHTIEIVGVTEPAFNGLDVGTSVDLFLPLCSEKVIHGESSHLDTNAVPGNYRYLFAWLSVIGRPKPGVPAQQAMAQLNTLAPEIFKATLPQHWSAEGRDQYLKRTFDSRSVANGLSYVRSQYRQSLWILMATVCAVLLIACANVANLMLARNASRQRETAIRLALGSGRGRLIGQLLTEVLLLSVFGTLLGVLAAHWATRLLIRFLAVSLDLTPDLRVLAFTACATVLTALLIGVAPAWRGTRVTPQDAMKANARGVIEGAKFGMGRLLVVVQVALSLLLLVGAGLMLSTFWRLATLNPGFDRDHVLLASVDLRFSHYPPERRPAVYRDMLSRMRAIPGVRAASAADATPICGYASFSELVIDGGENSSASLTAHLNLVSDRYFDTLGTPLVAGRDFHPHDSPSSPAVAIINQTMAARAFGRADPIGRRFRVREGDRLSGPVEIVGVAKDAKYESLREVIPPTVYRAWNQDAAPDARINFALLTDGEPSSLRGAVKSVMSEADHEVSIEFSTLADQVSKSIARERLLATLLGLFGGVALLLAMIGLYGVLSYHVARRRNEIAIRMAVGAERRRVVLMVLREVFLLAGTGVLLGVGLAMGTTRFVAAVLYGVTPTDPFTLSLAVVALTGVSAFAGYLPARRASRVDPMTTLREE